MKECEKELNEIQPHFERQLFETCLNKVQKLRIGFNAFRQLNNEKVLKNKTRLNAERDDDIMSYNQIGSFNNIKIDGTYETIKEIKFDDSINETLKNEVKVEQLNIPVNNKNESSVQHQENSTQTNIFVAEEVIVNSVENNDYESEIDELKEVKFIDPRKKSKRQNVQLSKQIEDDDIILKEKELESTSDFSDLETTDDENSENGEKKNDSEDEEKFDVKSFKKAQLLKGGKMLPIHKDPSSSSVFSPVPEKKTFKATFVNKLMIFLTGLLIFSFIYSISKFYRLILPICDDGRKYNSIFGIFNFEHINGAVF